MTRVHSAPNSVEIHNLKNVLEAQGIECEVRGEFRKAGAGELPVNECWVELWILDDGREAEARQILDASSIESLPAWSCPKCGESVEGQFDVCWSCQSPRTAA